MSDTIKVFLTVAIYFLTGCTLLALSAYIVHLTYPDNNKPITVNKNLYKINTLPITANQKYQGRRAA